MAGCQSLWSRGPAARLVVALTGLGLGTTWLWNSRRSCSMVAIPAVGLSVLSAWLVLEYIWQVTGNLMAGVAPSPRTLIHSLVLLGMLCILVYMILGCLEAMLRRDRTPVRVEER